MLFGMAWYKYVIYSAIAGLVIPWVVIYREVRDNFDDGFMWGLKIYLGISAVVGAAVLLMSILARFVISR